MELKELLNFRMFEYLFFNSIHLPYSKPIFPNKMAKN